MKTIKLIAKTMIRELPSMVYKIFDKKFEGSGINLCQINDLQMNLTHQLLEHLREEKFILLLKIIFGLLI